MAGDRIWEAYSGKLGNTMMKSSKGRIDWICSKVEGSYVLDVGCSQGISSIILAKAKR